MLVSHDYKFIYIKSRKTASTTIERYLSPFCKNGIVQLKKAHKPATAVRDEIGEKVWSSYTKICTIRNPWDKMVSHYHWKRRFRLFNKIVHKLHPKWSNYNPAHELSFTEYIKSDSFYNLDEKILFVDDEWPAYEFIRYEHLFEDLEKVCNLIGIPFNTNKIGTYKSGYRPKKRYQEFYDDESKELVAEKYPREIEKMKYEF